MEKFVEAPELPAETIGSEHVTVRAIRARTIRLATAGDDEVGVFGILGGDLPVMVRDRKPKGKKVERSTRQDFGMSKYTDVREWRLLGQCKANRRAACAWRDRRHDWVRCGQARSQAYGAGLMA